MFKLCFPSQTAIDGGFPGFGLLLDTILIQDVGMRLPAELCIQDDFQVEALEDQPALWRPLDSLEKVWR